MCTALIYWGLSEGVDYLQETKYERLNELMSDGNAFGAWGLTVLLMMGLLLPVVVLCLFAPAAIGRYASLARLLRDTTIGFTYIYIMLLAIHLTERNHSGIPDIMCYLNGVKTPGMLGWKTFVAKYIGTILAIGAGLSLGPEGWVK